MDGSSHCPRADSVRCSARPAQGAHLGTGASCWEGWNRKPKQTRQQGHSEHTHVHTQSKVKSFILYMCWTKRNCLALEGRLQISSPLLKEPEGALRSHRGGRSTQEPSQASFALAPQIKNPEHQRPSKNEEAEHARSLRFFKINCNDSEHLPERGNRKRKASWLLQELSVRQHHGDPTGDQDWPAGGRMRTGARDGQAASFLVLLTSKTMKTRSLQEVSSAPEN